MGMLMTMGFFLGILIYLFTFIAAKKTGKFYLAPLVTFLIAMFIVFYSLFKIGGFEGMGFGILGACMWGVAIIGVLFLPFMKGMKKSEFTKLDKSILVIIPLLLFALIGWGMYESKGYWISGEGDMAAGQGTATYYTISTISEGKKQLLIQLGEEYEGKAIKIENIKTIGNTEIIISTIDEGEVERLPYIKIGLDKIVEPLEIRMKDGENIPPKFDYYFWRKTPLN
ncbi:hypothetical protein [Lederbergia ruris]|uniref:hypothetical protein n=1 Tax=Lederbergia ruris TaxID=217495 RepID=UPI0039A1E7F7